MNKSDEFHKRIAELDAELQQSRKEIARLIKLVQKLQSNIMKASVERVDIDCTCTNKNYVDNTSTKTKRICLNCGGC